MFSSFMYHMFGIRNQDYSKIHYQKDSTIIFTHFNPRKLRCPACKSANIILRGSHERTFRSLPIGSKPLWIRLNIPRIHCQKCGVLRQVKLVFADPKRSYTRALERFVVELSQYMTLSDIARYLQLGWATVKEIVKRNLNRRFHRPPLKHLRLLAVDEIAVKKGHKYLTIVLDLESGAVVFVGLGKDAQALDPFWRRLRSSKADIQAVAMDMSAAYRKAVSTHLPKAVIVFDHFHVIKLFNEKLSALRRQLQQKAEDEQVKTELKGTRWLLLKNPENLEEARNEKERLKSALALNQPLYTAYYLKEDLRQFWDQRDKETARRFLNDWIARAQSSNVAMLETFSQTLLDHYEGLLAYYDYPISTGPLEGTNNKIKVLKRDAYGYTDMDFFTLRIYAIHLSKHALIGGGPNSK